MGLMTGPVGVDSLVRTVMVKLRPAIFVTFPNSWTSTVTELVLGDCATVGCHEKTAVFGRLPLTMEAPAGADERLHRSELAGTLLVTETVIERDVPGVIFVLLIGLITRGPMNCAAARRANESSTAASNKRVQRVHVKCAEESTGRLPC